MITVQGLPQQVTSISPTIIITPEEESELYRSSSQLERLVPAAE